MTIYEHDTGHYMKAGGQPPTAAGFSLIELMVVLLIASILIAIAVPSYNASVSKARRTDAKNALLDLAAREERYYATNSGTYSAVAANLGYSGTFPVTLGVTGSQYYQLNVASVTAQTSTTVATYTLTATPINAQASDVCGTYTLTSAGVQSVSGTATGCW